MNGLALIVRFKDEAACNRNSPLGASASALGQNGPLSQEFASKRPGLAAPDFKTEHRFAIVKTAPSDEQFSDYRRVMTDRAVQQGKTAPEANAEGLAFAKKFLTQYKGILGINPWYLCAGQADPTTLAEARDMEHVQFWVKHTDMILVQEGMSEAQDVDKEFAKAGKELDLFGGSKRRSKRRSKR